MNGELALHEERAQHGIIEFAEEMQIIRDGNMYPGANREPDAWAKYCKDRWSMSFRSVEEQIRALPILKRRGAAAPVGSAAQVATLPEAVQDEILDTTKKRDDVKAKAKAVRKAAKRIVEQEGREPTDDELVEVARAKPKEKKKAKPKMKDSKFISFAAPALSHLERAADYAQENVLSDTENDWGWWLVERMRYHADRISERLYKPEHVRDMNEEFAKLLANSNEDEQSA